MCKMGVQVIERRAHMPLYGYLLPSLIKHGTGKFLTTQSIFKPGFSFFSSVLTTKGGNVKQTICRWWWHEWDGACMTGFTHQQKTFKSFVDRWAKFTDKQWDYVEKYYICNIWKIKMYVEETVATFFRSLIHCSTEFFNSLETSGLLQHI